MGANFAALWSNGSGRQNFDLQGDPRDHTSQQTQGDGRAFEEIDDLVPPYLADAGISLSVSDAQRRQCLEARKRSSVVIVTNYHTAESLDLFPRFPGQNPVKTGSELEFSNVVRTRLLTVTDDKLTIFSRARKRRPWICAAADIGGPELDPDSGSAVRLAMS